MPGVVGAPSAIDEPRALRRLLVRGLREEGARKLCKEEPSDFTLRSELLSVALLCSALLGLVIFAVDQLGWSFWDTIAALVLALLGAVAAAKLTTPLVPYLLVLLGWTIAGVVQLAGPGLDALFLSHGLPFAIILGARWGWRALRLAAGIPLFVPVALIVVLLPLLSEDPWRLGAAAGWQLAALAAVAITSLLALVAARFLRLSLTDVFDAAAERLATTPKPEDEALELVKKLWREEDRDRLDEERVRKRLRLAYEAPLPAERAPQIADTIGRGFKRRAVLRLLPLTAGIASAAWGLIYVLAWGAVPASLAAEWSGRAVPRAELALLGVDVSLPLGPYLTVAALLAIVATAGFLAFALTEDRHSAALSEALLSRPAERVLLLALPYIALNEPKKRARRPSRRRTQEAGRTTEASQR